MSTQSLNDQTRSLLKVGLVANILESYEFAVYTFLVPIIGKLFLQASDPRTLYIQSYLIFAVSFLARPFGSLFWGYYADRIGRGRSLKASLLAMSIPTTLTGLLPTYKEIGFLAPLCFLILRFMQGFSKGGEYSISGCYIYEMAPRNQRSFLCGTVSASAAIGMLCGSFMGTVLFWCFDSQTLELWAWRIPYLLGIPITYWVGRIRKSVQEPHIQEVRKKELPSMAWTSKEMRRFLLKLPPVILIGGFMELCCYTLFTWMPSYLSHFLNIDLSVAQFCNSVGFNVWIGFILLAGHLSNRFGYKKIIAVHTISMIVLLFPLFKLLQVGTYAALLTANIIFAWLNSGVPAVMMEVLGDAFPKKRRALGMSIGQNVAATLLGGTAPFVSSLVIDRTGLVMFPAYYIIGVGILILPLISYLKPYESEEA